MYDLLANITERYRHELPSDLLWEEVNHCISKIAPIMETDSMECLSYFYSPNIESDIKFDGKIQYYANILSSLLRIFYSLNCIVTLLYSNY